MLGSYAPQSEPYIITVPRRTWEEAPSGGCAHLLKLCMTPEARCLMYVRERGSHVHRSPGTLASQWASFALFYARLLWHCSGISSELTTYHELLLRPASGHSRASSCQVLQIAALNSTDE